MSAWRPNILLIMSDEHAADVMGCYGDKLNPTPNLDALVARGLVLDNCYTTSPVCAPARHSFTAGQYVSRCGAWSNNCRLPSDEHPSLPRALQAAGYETYLCGKMHYDPQHRYGFTELFPFYGNRKPKSGRGKFREPDNLESNPAQWQARFRDFRVADDLEPFRADPSVSECDAYITDRAIEFLRQHHAQPKPWFLTVGYHAPHFPLVVPRRYHEMFAGRVPPPLPAPASLPLNYRHRRAIHGLDHATPEQTQFGRELYWALTRWLDEQIGRLLAAADLDNTVVIYTSDHGEMKGDLGFWWKLTMYESAARIPAILTWPGIWPGGQRRQGACSLVDLVQTIVDIAGGRAPADWNGSSLLPWLNDAGHPWKDFAVSECYGCGTPSGFAMYRHGQYKYVYHAPANDHPAERELYDLQADPHELHNLAGNPAHADHIAELHRRLVAETGDPDEINERSRRELSKGYE
jgi:choline-sulfatase